MSFVTIAIATYKRKEGLKRLLNSLSSINYPSNSFEVVVFDNCADESEGYNYVNNNAPAFSYKISARIVPERGISNSRNSMLDYFYDNDNVDFLAMIDDDQEVDSNWLLSLVNDSITFDADFVGSTVIPKFSSKPPTWCSQLELFNRKKREAGIVPYLHGTGGVLLRKKPFFYAYKQYFDLDFSLTGGGDKEFFYRAMLNGAKSVYSSSSRCYEHYDVNRINKQWAITRAQRIGNAEARLKVKNGQSKFNIFLSASVKGSIQFILMLIFFFNKDVCFKYRLSLFHKICVFNGLIGNSKIVY